jgi:hypothetical protein
MVTITLNKNEDDEIIFRPVVISSISLDRALLGSSVRALDGSLLTYIGGAKKEHTISVTATINEAMGLQDWEASGETVSLLVEDQDGVKLSDYDCVISDVGVSYSQTEGMAELSFTAREI